MAHSTFSNFKYQVDKTPFNKTRNVTVSFDYNGKPVKKVLVFKDKKNANYTQDAKKIIEQERKNGTLDKYCKKYIKPKASPLTVALVSIAAVAALATTGLAAYTVAKGIGGGGDTPTPAVTYYTVDFNTYGGSFVKSEQVKKGEKATRPNNPTKIIGDVEYEFGGWFKDEKFADEYKFDTPVNNDFVLFAKWKGEPKPPVVVTHNLTYHFDNATTPEQTYVETYNENDVTVEPTWVPEYAGHTFAGWYTKAGTEGEAFTFGNKLTDDTEAYAHWTEDPSIFAVNFYTYDEDGDGQPDLWKTEYIEEGKDAIEPMDHPEPPTGQEFVDWFVNKQGEGEDIPFVFDGNPIQAETNIYAHFSTQVQIVIHDPFSSATVVQEMTSGAPLVFPDYDYQILPSGDARTGVTKWVDENGADAPATVPTTPAEYFAVTDSIPFDFTVDCTGTSFTIEGKSKVEAVYDYGDLIQVGFDGTTFPDAAKIQIELIDRLGDKISCESEWYTYDSAYGTITIQTNLEDDDGNPIFGQIRYINISVSA